MAKTKATKQTAGPLYPKAWLDQPDVVQAAQPLVVSIGVGDQRAEMREHPDGRVFLSIGNLFGSQTLECLDLRCAVLALAQALKATKKKPMGAPTGCTVLENV